MVIGNIMPVRIVQKTRKDNMGQREIYHYLLAHKGQKFTVRELAKELKISSSTITTNLNSLLKTDVYKVKKRWKKMYRHGMRKIIEVYISK
jgi:predicted transcriptional regulator